MIEETKYKCRVCGHISNTEAEAYEHLNESSEEDKIYQEGYEQEFEGDFPKIKDYYDFIKPYFLRIIGEQ